MGELTVEIIEAAAEGFGATSYVIELAAGEGSAPLLTQHFKSAAPAFASFEALTADGTVPYLTLCAEGAVGGPVTLAVSRKGVR